MSLKAFSLSGTGKGSTMNKNKMIKEIIEPYMEANGFVKQPKQRGFWCWKKEIQGIPQSITITDIQGMVSMELGTSACGIPHVPAANIMSNLHNPRTKMWDWTYRFYEGDKELLYENILKDFRDLLEICGERVLLEHTEKRKKSIPNRRHFYYLSEHYDELVKKYSEQLAFRDESIIEKWEVIADKIIALSESPVEEVEEQLLGYVAVMETEMIQMYGGRRGIDTEAETCYVLVGKKEKVFNFLTRFFSLWKNRTIYEDKRKEIEEWCKKQEL